MYFKGIFQFSHYNIVVDRDRVGLAMVFFVTFRDLNDLDQYILDSVSLLTMKLRLKVTTERQLGDKVRIF